MASGNGRGFIGSAEGAAARSAAREMMGVEAYERTQRSLELLRHPRPMTDPEREVLQETAAPVLRDLAASGLPRPDIRAEAHEYRGDEAVCAWIQGPGQAGAGIWIWLASSPADKVAELAEQFQNWAADRLVDAGRSPDWPICPAHPLSHGLNPQSRDGVAVWACPEDGQVICEIGALRPVQGPGVRA